MKTESVPNEVLIATVEGAAKYEQQMASTYAETSRALDRLVDDCRKDIRAAIPREKEKEYDEVHRSIKERFSELAATRRHTTEGLKAEAQTRAKLLLEAKQTVAKLGINAKQIEAIQRKYLTQADALVEKSLPALADAPYVMTSSDDAPWPTHNPYTYKNPPYQNYWGTTQLAHYGGWAQLYHSESLWGWLACVSSESIHGAGDSNYVRGELFSEVRFEYRMPAPGRLEVWIALESDYPTYGGWLDDEWGFSDASIIQRTSAYLRMFVPYGGSYTYNTLVEYRRGEDEGYWRGDVPHGEQRLAHMLSPGVYQAGEWVTCGVGIKDTNYFWVNDMSCYCYMTTKWNVTSVAVRSSGAP